MKIWITKYALTAGITKADVRESEAADGLIVVKNELGWNQYFHGEGNEWHRTRESAVAKAEAMRLAKINSLRRSIAKMEKLTFDA